MSAFCARSTGQTALLATYPLQNENAVVLTESINSRMASRKLSSFPGGISRHMGSDRNCSRLTGQPEVETDGRGGATMIYEISAPKGKTTVAVKITDMLGEEVIAAKEI